MSLETGCFRPEAGRLEVYTDTGQFGPEAGRHEAGTLSLNISQCIDRLLIPFSN